MIQNKIYLKNKFKNGSRPTQQDYYDLIDTIFYLSNNTNDSLKAELYSAFELNDIPTEVDYHNIIDAAFFNVSSNIELSEGLLSVQSGLSSEINNRQMADSSLSTRIDSNVSEISALALLIDTLNTNLSTEISTRSQETSSLDGRIDILETSISTIDSTLDQEILDRGFGDSNLQDQIDDLVIMDSSLDGRLDDVEAQTTSNSASITTINSTLGSKLDSALIGLLTSSGLVKWNITTNKFELDTNSYLTSFTELDPTVPSHVKSITQEDITRWDAGGDIDLSGYYTKTESDGKYLTSFTESDPIFNSWLTTNSTNISNWNTAVTWGNHASAGYLTSLPNDLVYKNALVNYIDFENVIPSYKEGRIYYDYGTHTWNMMSEYSGVTLQPGEESWVRARNDLTQTIPNGTVVYMSGVQGSKIIIGLADNTIEHTADRVIGITTHDILPNQVGVVTTFGSVGDLNTNSFNEQDIIYLGTNGQFTKDKPTSTNSFIVKLGFVSYKHQNKGTIFISISPSNYLNDLFDVGNITMTLGHSLVVDENGKWSNKLLTYTKSDVGLGNVDNTSDLNKPISNATQTALNAKLDSSSAFTKASADTLYSLIGHTHSDYVTNTLLATTLSGYSQVGHKHNSTDINNFSTDVLSATNGVYAPLVSNKIPSQYLPDVAITDTFVINSQVAMLSLTAQRGDVAVRTDESKTYILKTDDPTLLSNWQEILTPTGSIGVISVNGKSGTNGVVVLTTDDISDLNQTNKFVTSAQISTWNGYATTIASKLDSSVISNYILKTDFTFYNKFDTSFTTNKLVKWDGTKFVSDSTTYSIDGHNHDSLYNTKTEIGNFFGGTTSITGYNKSNWDTAFGWGNHSGLYALLSHSHSISNITDFNIVTPSSNQFLRYNSTSSKWENISVTLFDGNYNSLTNKPTLFSGSFVDLTSKPTTLSGYGITDATPSSHIGSNGSSHAIATISVDGFMSSTDKTKLDGIASSANNYSLPIATASVLGGVKTGTGVSINATTGVLSVNYGTTSTTACVGNDSRLSNARTPTAHNQTWSTITSTPTTLSGYGISSTDTMFDTKYASSSHTHTIADITSLQTSLDSKLTATITTPASGNVVRYNGTSWVNAQLSYNDLSNLPSLFTQATADTLYQSKDADLTAIGALSGSSGLLKKTAVDTWTLDTTSYQTAFGTQNKNLIYASSSTTDGQLPSFRSLVNADLPTTITSKFVQNSASITPTTTAGDQTTNVTIGTNQMFYLTFASIAGNQTNHTLNFSAMSDGEVYQVQMTQSTTYKVTNIKVQIGGVATNVKFASGDFVLSTTSGAIDVLTISKINGTIHCILAKDFK